MLGSAKGSPFHGYVVNDFLDEWRMFKPQFCDIIVLWALPRLLRVLLDHGS